MHKSPGTWKNQGGLQVQWVAQPGRNRLGMRPPGRRARGKGQLQVRDVQGQRLRKPLGRKPRGMGQLQVRDLQGRWLRDLLV